MSNDMQQISAGTCACLQMLWLQERGMFKILQKEKVLSISDGWPDASPAKDKALRS